MIGHNGPKRENGARWIIRESLLDWGNPVDKTLVGRTIELIHESDFASVPEGTELISIFGERVVKGKNHIDDDIREGYYAYGTLVTE